MVNKNTVKGFQDISGEEAKKRDHRKIGKEMELFHFDDEVGPGLPLWLPNGSVIIEELENLAKDFEKFKSFVSSSL